MITTAVRRQGIFATVVLLSFISQMCLCSLELRQGEVELVLLAGWVMSLLALFSELPWLTQWAPCLKLISENNVSARYPYTAMWDPNLHSSSGNWRPVNSWAENRKWGPWEIEAVYVWWKELRRNPDNKMLGSEKSVACPRAPWKNYSSTHKHSNRPAGIPGSHSKVGERPN